MQFGLKAKQQNGVKNTLLQIEFKQNSCGENRIFYFHQDFFNKICN